MSLPPCHVSLLPVRVSLSCLSTVHCSVLPGYVCLPLSSPSPAHRQFQTPPSRGVYLSLTCPRAPPARAVSIPHLGAPLPWPSGFTCATAAIAQQFTHVLENLLHRISPAPAHAADTSPHNCPNYSHFLFPISRASTSVSPGLVPCCRSGELCPKPLHDELEEKICRPWI
jgi:hypothetical protein